MVNWCDAFVGYEGRSVSAARLGTGSSSNRKVSSIDLTSMEGSVKL